MTPSRPQLVLAGAVCAVLAVAGIVVYLTAPSIEFGWFAYSPLPEEMTVPSNPALSGPAR